MTPNPLADMTADQIGPLVAQAMKWSGPDIFAAMLEAVTDANFHTEAAALIRAWHEPQLTNAAPVLFNALQQLTEAATHHEADARAALEAARSALKLATQTN
jgi:hypothetical protein